MSQEEALFHEADHMADQIAKIVDGGSGEAILVALCSVLAHVAISAGLSDAELVAGIAEHLAIARRDGENVFNTKPLGPRGHA